MTSVRGQLPVIFYAPLLMPLQESEARVWTLGPRLPTPLPSPGARHWQLTHTAHLRHSGSISGFNKPHADLQYPVPLSGTHTSMVVFVNTVVLLKEGVTKNLGDTGIYSCVLGEHPQHVASCGSHARRWLGEATLHCL